jgi:N-acetylglucosaminyl-diphospho-decaprenol L-rhamnosyltransferase
VRESFPARLRTFVQSAVQDRLRASDFAVEGPNRLGLVQRAPLGIVILAYGGGGEYRAVVDSLRADGLNGARLVVVHNPAAPDEARPAVEDDVEVVLSPGNLGYAGGMNLGLRRLNEEGFDHALVLTHDAALRPGCLDALRAAAARRPDLGALGPVMLRPGGEEPFSYGGTRRRDGTNAHLKAPGPAEEGIAPVEWIDGGAMLLSGAALDRVGGFDERFWSYCEDVDLCLRLDRAGFGVGVVLDARADQEPGSNKRPGAWAYLTLRNGAACARLAAGRPGLVRFLLRGTAETALQALRAALRASHLRPGSAREPWAMAVGGFRGLCDYARGRWGPPPAGLPGMGDMRNV